MESLNLFRLKFRREILWGKIQTQASFWLNNVEKSLCFPMQYFSADSDLEKIQTLQSLW